MEFFNRVFLKIDVNPTKYVIVFQHVLFWYMPYTFSIYLVFYFVLSQLICAKPVTQAFTDFAEPLAVRPKVSLALPAAIMGILSSFMATWIQANNIHVTCFVASQVVNL